MVDMYDGDTVGAQAGARPVIHANGVAKADFVIGREGDAGTTSRPASPTACISKNMSHIRVSNLEITNTTGTRQMAVGVVVGGGERPGRGQRRPSDGLYVHDMYGTLTEKNRAQRRYLHHHHRRQRRRGHATRYDDVSVENCTVANVSRTGISVGSSHSAYYWERHPGGVIPEEVKAKVRPHQRGHPQQLCGGVRRRRHRAPVLHCAPHRVQRQQRREPEHQGQLRRHVQRRHLALAL